MFVTQCQKKLPASAGEIKSIVRIVFLLQPGRRHAQPSSSRSWQTHLNFYPWCLLVPRAALHKTATSGSLSISTAGKAPRKKRKKKIQKKKKRAIFVGANVSLFLWALKIPKWVCWQAPGVWLRLGCVSLPLYCPSFLRGHFRLIVMTTTVMVRSLPKWVTISFQHMLFILAAAVRWSRSASAWGEVVKRASLYCRCCRKCRFALGRFPVWSVAHRQSGEASEATTRCRRATESARCDESLWAAIF